MVDDVVEIEHGIEAVLHGERFRVEVVGVDVVRLSMSRGGVFDEQPTHAVCVDPLSRATPFRVERDPDAVRVITAGLVVTLGLAPFRVDVHRSDGSPVIESVTDATGASWTYATLNDAFVLRRRCRREDAFYGLGEKSGRHNRRGRDYTMWNVDVLNPYETAEFTRGLAPDDPRADLASVEFDPYYAAVPLLHHQSGADGRVGSSFVDNAYRGRYELSRPREYRIGFAGGTWTEYVFGGPVIADILRDYTWLTGRAAPPPLWALGYHQCRWHPYTSTDLESLATRLRSEDVPCDALWLDIDYMDGYRVFTWNRDLIPDEVALLDSLRAQGFRVITIVDPGVKFDPGYPVFDEGVRRGVFCRTEGGDLYLGQVWPGDTAFPDFATPAARNWWGELNAAHVESGLAGIWNDMNEPATGRIDSSRMRFDGGRAPHGRYHNQYALLMAMGTREGLLAARPDLRTFILSRAGFAGIQRYAANWMGDNQARWDHLRLSIAMGAGMGLSGQPFVGADVGGFDGDTDAELLVRWTQYGVLTPFCRNHSLIGNVDQYPWSFGSEALDLIRAAVRLRYRLLPYVYASFLRCTQTGEPLQRPLVFDHQDDPRVRDLDDQYLFGPDLLVAPALEPGLTSRQVYLPAGGWYDWHTGELQHGPRHVVAATPLDRIPLYARAGAVVPMWPDAPSSTDGHHPDVVELHVFVPLDDGPHESILVEDDGLTLAREQLRTVITLQRAGDRLAFRTRVEGRPYPEFRRERLRLILHGAGVGGDRVVEVDDRGTDLRLELELD